MKAILASFILGLVLALSGCVVATGPYGLYAGPAVGPYCGKVWVPGYRASSGVWVRAHWRYRNCGYY